MEDLDLIVSSPSFKKQNHKEVEDRISSFPDCLLLCILSFLTTKDAVRTSILSKRWKYLWTSLSNIEVDDLPLDWWEKFDCCPIRKLHFLKFVDNLMFQHDSSNIEKFHLSFDIPIQQSHVNAWISAAIGHGVQELVLSLSIFSSYTFSCPLFDFGTLTVLKLENCILNIPIASCFRNLRICHLSPVFFLNNDQSNRCLFPNSPVLHDLVLEKCAWKKSSTLIIAIPSLKRFKMSFDDLNKCIKIYAPNLEVLKLWGCFLCADIILWNSHSLAKASLNFSVWGTSCESQAKHAIKIFRSIQMVDSLKIHGSVLSVFSLVQDLHLVDQLPTCNLTHLKVLFNDYKYIGTDLMVILLRSPKMESLFIDESKHTDDYGASDKWMQYSPPSSFEPLLKRVTIDGFKGNEAEVHLLEILLKHAGSLESIHLKCFSQMSEDREKQEEIKNMLMMLPRASPSCVIKLD